MSRTPGLIPLDVVSNGDGFALEIDGPRTTTSLLHRRSRLANTESQRAQLAAVPLRGGPSGEGSFRADLAESGWKVLKPAALEILQINLGKLCNMTCRHCHVDAGPDRTDAVMDKATVDACLRAVERTGVRLVDLTGGAPELNPHFEYVVDTLVSSGVHVMDRCNLTILTTHPYRHLARWMAERGVEVICSLPHYRRVGTDAQRGDGAYARSVEALRLLNAAGYGQGDPRRRLVLVSNPVGAFLAGNQRSLEAEWKRGLEAAHGVRFDALFVMNNMPISRYLEWLLERNLLQEYMQRLVNAFNPATIAGLMCRNTLSVSWDGRVFDCDFNQMLEMDLELPNGLYPDIRSIDLAAWHEHEIRTGRHCYGCTAGGGSSCGGAIQ